ncbi:hypothetical protein IT400_00535 [Candidatus Nomurabacteria bacterium]|nr:hypothetical protein [Candidatus Nomurabacteria bacterium]
MAKNEKRVEGTHGSYPQDNEKEDSNKKRKKKEPGIYERIMSLLKGRKAL